MSEYFSKLRKEIFAEFINGSQFQVTNPGPLHAPTVSVEIRRDKNLQLILETVLQDGATSTYVRPTPGTVGMIGGKAELTSLGGGVKATLTGISPRGTRPQWNERAGVFATIERASLNAVDVDLNWKEPQAYLVEWFLMRPGWVLWPEASKTKTLLHQNVSIGETTRGLEIALDSTAEDDISWDMVTLNVDGHRIYLRESHARKMTKNRGRCMLIYCDETTQEFRNALQDCISLALGIHLVYLGYTAFSQTWDITSMRAVRGYSINKRVFSLPPQPPSPLSAKSYNQMDVARFNRFVNALSANHERLHLRELSWGYWHALCAPAHIAAAHYGAIIEALRAAYVESNPALCGGKVITDPTVWSGISADLQAVLDKAGLKAETLNILRNKVANLNSLPGGKLMELVCRTIGVQLGESETASWSRRNRSAHGAQTNPDEQVQTVRDIKLLNLVVNRMLIAMTDASDSYIDYCSAGHPVRNIADPVPTDALGRDTPT